MQNQPMAAARGDAAAKPVTMAASPGAGTVGVVPTVPGVDEVADGEHAPTAEAAPRAAAAPGQIAATAATDTVAGDETDGLADKGVVAAATDPFLLDARMALLEWVGRPNRLHYYYVQRAMDRARTGYHRLVSAADLTGIIADLADDDPTCPTDINVAAVADELVAMKVLAPSHDGSRAATIADYRKRLAVYQFTPLGFVAYRGFEQVLQARPEEASLTPLAFADIHADLLALADANRRRDEQEVYRKLSRLDRALTDMAEHAARFHVLLAGVSRSTDGSHETFLAHKNALLSHLREFHDELSRYAPRMRSAVEAVEATGVDTLVDAAAHADERPMLELDRRRVDWAERWAGLVAWFTAGTGEAARLDQQTVTAIHDLIAMLRRLTDTTSRGISRDSQLRYLAGWFADCPEEVMHALFAVAFNWSRARHLAADYDDPDAIGTHKSWWDAPPLDLHQSLRRSGRQPGPGRIGRIRRNTALRNRLRREQAAAERARAEAARQLAQLDVHTAVLTRPQTDVLLRLLDHALGSRSTTPITGQVTGNASEVGVRLTLHPHTRPTVVHTADGRLLLDGLRLEVSPTRGRDQGGPQLTRRMADPPESLDGRQ